VRLRHGSVGLSNEAPADTTHSPSVAVGFVVDAHRVPLDRGPQTGHTSVAHLSLDRCRGKWPTGRRRAWGTKKPRVRGASLRCAEEDSNLHPVIPDQALNLARQVSYASIPRQIVHSVAATTSASLSRRRPSGRSSPSRSARPARMQRLADALMGGASRWCSARCSSLGSRSRWCGARRRRPSLIWRRDWRRPPRRSSATTRSWPSER